jgi:hypothetical protein
MATLGCFFKNHLSEHFFIVKLWKFSMPKRKLPLHHLVLILWSCKNKSCHDQVYHQLSCLSSLFNLLLLLTKLMNSFIYSKFFLKISLFDSYMFIIYVFLLGEFSQLGI